MHGQVFILQRWKKNFDPVKEKLLSPLLCVLVPVSFWRPEVNQFWKRLLNQLVKIYKIDNNSEVISKGLFARFCLTIGISKPLKVEKIQKGCLFARL